MIGLSGIGMGQLVIGKSRQRRVRVKPGKPFDVEHVEPGSDRGVVGMIESPGIDGDMTSRFGRLIPDR